MTRPLKITKDVHFRSMTRGRKVIQEGVEADRPTLGRVPRVTRVMALAIHMADLRHQGEVADSGARSAVSRCASSPSCWTVR
jgi:hypothetical protein